MSKVDIEWEYHPEYEGVGGIFESMWVHQPKGFNPKASSDGVRCRKIVVAEMERLNYYKEHTRAECAVKWRELYDQYIKEIKQEKK